MSIIETIYNKRVGNSNIFNSIYLTFYKNNNVKIEVQETTINKRGFYHFETILKTKTTKDKIEDFLKNCDSFNESFYRFNDYQDFLKFVETFKKY